MLSSLYYGHYEFWAPYDPSNEFFGNQSVTFDGPNKLIYINADVSVLDVREDLYSNWKEWVQYADNSKFLPAIRSTGGDPISGTDSYTGDIYFLTNGWKLVVDLTSVAISGVLYSDDYATAYFDASLKPQYPVRVSSLVNTIKVTSAMAASDIAADVWSHNTRTLTQAIPAAPTATQIRQEMDANSTKLSAIKDKTDTITTAPSASEIRQEMDANSTKLQQLVSAIASLPQSSQDIVAAMIAALNATTIPVNIEAVNGMPITGTGTEQDPWGPQ